MVKAKKNIVETAGRRFTAVFIAIAVITLVLDQVSKYFIRSLESGASVPLIKNVLYITYAQNSGVAFSMLQGRIWIPIWISVIAVGVILYYYDDIVSKKTNSLLVGLIVAGILGNLVDRLAFGYVVDFIDFRFWPAFNIADAALTIGVVGLTVKLMRKHQIEDAEVDRFAEELSGKRSAVRKRKKIRKR